MQLDGASTGRVGRPVHLGCCNSSASCGLSRIGAAHSLGSIPNSYHAEISSTSCAQDFAEDFVLHRRIGFRPERIAELPLNHAERAFDVAPLMVMAQKLVAPKGEEMVHPFPERRTLSRRIALERDERRPAQRFISSRFSLLRYALSPVASLTVKFSAVVLMSGPNCGQSPEFFSSTTTARNDVRFHAASQVALDPIRLLPVDAVLFIEPFDVAAGGEAARIDRERRFDRAER